MQSISLREFSQFVPVCGEHDSVQAAIDAFSHHACPELVLLDSAQQPRGVIERGAFLLSLMQADRVVDRSAADATPMAATALTQWVEQHNLLMPIVTVPGGWTLADMAPHLLNLHRQPWVLVDTTGKLVGLLDRLALLQFLVTHSDTLPSAQAMAQPEEFSWRSPHSRTIPTPLPALLHLVEQLPVPAMVQTSSGRIVLQNLPWQQQIAAQELTLGWSISTFLHTHGLAQAVGGDRSPSASWVSGGDHSRTANPYRMSDRAETPSSTLPSCQIDRESNSCICVYPTPSGVEQSWQFFSIPVNVASLLPATAALWNSLLNAPTPSTVVTSDGGFYSPIPLASTTATAWMSTADMADLWLVVAQPTQALPPTVKELAAQNADLAQLNRLKDEFLASLSHELKTPLTAILGLANLLKSQQLGPLNDRQARYAQLIHQSGRHLVLVVNTILDLARIETGQMDLSLDRLDLRPLCQRAYEQAHQLLLAEEQVNSADATPLSLPSAFQLTLHPELTTVVADDVRLRQMLANLLSNALKFTPAHGTVGLTVEPWDGWIAFTVWDTGKGIAAERQPLVFQKMRQADHGADPRFEGTGLGLVLTQKLAHLHGGEITFTSSPGQGSRFTLLLPWHLSPADSPSVLRPAVRSEASRHLAVVVEPHPEVIERVSTQMQQIGYRVAIARSGTEAIEKIRRLHPALVLMDPALPLLSGWDVLTLLKTEAEIRAIPVLLMVAPEDRLRAAGSEANAVLNCPTTPQQIQDAIDRLVTVPPQRPVPSAPLTVLYLVPPPDLSDLEESSSPPLPDLNTLLHPYDCRLVEVDDLDQAELLARVWKPNVLLLNGTIPDPLTFFQDLQQSDYLAQLPLVTLTAELTEAAHRSGLAVFPCLAPLMGADGDRADLPALLQVLQVATIQHRVPTLLLADIALFNSPPDASPELNHALMSQTSVQQWLHAFSQYLQTAGFHCYPRESWDEILPLLRDRQVDLLLLPWHPVRSNTALLTHLQTLAEVAQGVPIVVWDCSAEAAMLGQSPLARGVKAIATTVLPASLSMAGLVEHLWQVLRHQSSDNS